MSILKYIIFSITFQLAMSDICFAQTYTNSPNDTIQITGGMEDLETLTIQQINISSDTITFKWKKISESVPANWEASVCDNQFCYTSLIDSGTMNPVSKPDYGLVLLHITAHVNYGTATIRYAVWDSKYPAKKDTLTFIMTVYDLAQKSNLEHKNMFTLFPNPVKDNFTIISNLEPGFQFMITDMVGKEIYSGNANENFVSVSTDSFPNGIYNVSVFNNFTTLPPKRLLIQH